MADLLILQRLAHEAQTTVDDPGFKAAYEKLYMAALDQFRRSMPEEHEKRDEAYWRLRTLEALSAEFDLAIGAPKREETRLDRHGR